MRGTRLRTAPFLSANGVKKGGEFAKKAEFANILFNIMSEKRAKRGYKRRKGIAAFREGYEQHGKHGGVKKGRKEKWKKVLTKACGGGIIAKLSDERDKRARPR